MTRPALTRYRRVRPGLYRSTDGRVEIRAVDPEAIRAGYSGGWHLTVDGAYWHTFRTLHDARNAYELAVLGGLTR